MQRVSGMAAGESPTLGTAHLDSSSASPLAASRTPPVSSPHTSRNSPAHTRSLVAVGAVTSRSEAEQTLTGLHLRSPHTEGARDSLQAAGGLHRSEHAQDGGVPASDVPCHEGRCSTGAAGPCPQSPHCQGGPSHPPLDRRVLCPHPAPMPEGPAPYTLSPRPQQPPTTGLLCTGSRTCR